MTFASTRGLPSRRRVALLAPSGNTAVREEVSTLVRRFVADSLGTVDESQLPVIDDVVMVSVGSGTYAGSLRGRIADYLDDLPQALRTVRGLGADLVMFGHTGCSYVDHDRVLASLEQSGIRYVTAVDSLVADIARRGAEQIELLTPYPAAVHRDAVSYWRARGVGVVFDHSYAGYGGADSIYALTEKNLVDASAEIGAGATGDLVVVSGTGAPSIGVLDDLARSTGTPWTAVNAALAREAADIIVALLAGVPRARRHQG